jgi:hypothetical protein
MNPTSNHGKSVARWRPARQAFPSDFQPGLEVARGWAWVLDEFAKAISPITRRLQRRKRLGSGGVQVGGGTIDLQPWRTLSTAFLSL